MEDSAAVSTKLRQRWPSTCNKSEWRNWVARLKSSPFSNKWKHAGIYDAIIMSTNKIRLDTSLVTAGLRFWNSATNTMDLPNLGMMSPTLFDVAAITGFRPHGKEVSALTIPSPKKLNLDGVIGVDLIYSKFLRQFMGEEEQQITVEEHIAFLLYWLCKYVFCVAACKIIKEWAGLAEALALCDDGTNDEPFALGQIMLAHLYRGLQQDCSGPIWLFQMWLQLYFPELAPFDVTYHQDQILGASLAAASATTPNHTPEKCFKVLHRCTSRTDDEWSVCLNREYPAFLKLFWQSNSSEEVAYNNIRVSILTTRDINFGVKVGISAGKPSNHICGAELYCPDHFARQLGCKQCIPKRVISSVNEYSSLRHRLVTLSEVKELSNKAKSFLMKFKDQPCNKTFECSVEFVTWWKEKMERSSVEVKHERQEFVPSSSSGSVRDLKRMRSNGTPNPGIEIINLDDDDEDKEMTLEDYRLMKRNKNMENQDVPPGFEQAISTATPSSVSKSPLSVQENTNASFSQQLNDMEDFVKFKTTIQDLMNSRSLPSMEITVLQDQLSDVESHLPKFITSKEDLVGANKNLKRWLNLLPGATSKLETVDHRCSELDDEVKQLDSTLADFETKISQVRLQRAQKVAELKTEREMRAQIQQIVDKINQFGEKKKELESNMERIREMYDLLLKRALELT